MLTHKITSEAILDKIDRHLVYWYHFPFNESAESYLNKRFKEDYPGNYELNQLYDAASDYYEFYISFPTESDELWFMMKYYG